MFSINSDDTRGTSCDTVPVELTVLSCILCLTGGNVTNAEKVLYHQDFHSYRNGQGGPTVNNAISPIFEDKHGIHDT